MKSSSHKYPYPFLFFTQLHPNRVDKKMLKFFGQLRRRRRRTHHSDHLNSNALDSGGGLGTETASSGSMTLSSSTDHHDYDDDELRLASSSSRKRKQASYSSAVAHGGGGADVGRSCRGVVCVDETRDDVSGVDGVVDHVVGKGGDVSIADREDESDVSRVLEDVFVDAEEGDVSNADREVDWVGGDVSRSCRAADYAEEGDEVGKVDKIVDGVEGLNDDEAIIVKDETTSCCGGENVDNREGKPLEVAKNRMEVPPDDDCCPICFGSFVVPCRGPCGHWYCGGCILQYWNYTAALQPCSCPMCSQMITKLTPEASLSQQQDATVTEVLRNVRKYNRLFLGGPYGMILKMFELPLYIKRMFTEMMNPDRPGVHLNKLRIFAMTLGFFYSISPLDFLRLGRHNVVDLFDHLAIFLSFVLYGVGIYMRRRRLHNVRELAAVQLE